MKALILVLTLFTNYAFCQLVQKESAINNYVKEIDKIRSGKLVKVSYPNMSGCGGAVDGYYSDKKLVLIDATYNGESGYISKVYYLKNDRILKITYSEHFPESEKNDTLYSVVFADEILFYKEINKIVSKNKLDTVFISRLTSCGQQMEFQLQEVIDQVDSLKFVSDMPYICEGSINENNNPGCGDFHFWNVVRLRHNVIELLIDRLDDSTITEAVVANFDGNFTTADVAYSALQEIIHGIPTFELLGIPFDKEGCGYCSYWQHLNKSFSNRQLFKEAVRKWFHKNKDQLVWIKSDEFATCDCSGNHPNGGHYILP